MSDDNDINDNENSESNENDNNISRRVKNKRSNINQIINYKEDNVDYVDNLLKKAENPTEAKRRKAINAESRNLKKILASKRDRFLAGNLVAFWPFLNRKSKKVWLAKSKEYEFDLDLELSESESEEESEEEENNQENSEEEVGNDDDDDDEKKEENNKMDEDEDNIKNKANEKDEDNIHDEIEKSKNNVEENNREDVEENMNENETEEKEMADNIENTNKKEENKIEDKTKEVEEKEEDKEIENKTKEVEEKIIEDDLATKKKIVKALPKYERKVEYFEHDALNEQPHGIENGTLRDYQLDGLNWLIGRHDHGCPGILGDEMGLGKTVQSIALLGYLQRVRGVSGPHLVICPLSVLSSWMNEFTRWCPSLRVIRFHGPATERRRLTENVCIPGQFDVVVTTYEMVNSEEYFFMLRFHWRYVILDEAHRVKSETSISSQSITRMKYANIILLTGTPLQNNMHELWALLNMLFPDLFTDSKVFDNCFDLTRNVVDDKILELAHILLQPIMLRRVKKDVESKLPPKVETKIYVPLSPLQIQWYKRLLCKNFAVVETATNNNSMSDKQLQEQQENDQEWKKLMSLFMQLRKVCNHPYIFPSADTFHTTIAKELNDDQYHEARLQDILDGSGKLTILDKLLTKLNAEGHRVLLFSLFTSMLDLLEDYCYYRGWDYLRLDGSTNRVQRQIDINKFNAPNSKVFVFLVSTRAGGLGINLQTADTVIHYDSDFNPQVDLQAQDRCHRIGQTKTVHVYRLITSETVEERLIKRAERKLYLDMMVMGRSRLAQLQKKTLNRLTKKQVMSMLMFGADRIFRTKNKNALKDEHIEDIIERSKQRVAEEKRLLENMATQDDDDDDDNNNNNTENNNTENKQMENGVIVEENARHTVDQFDFSEPLKAIREFQGQVFMEERKSTIDSWLKETKGKKRKRTSRTVDITDMNGVTRTVLRDELTFDNTYNKDESDELSDESSTDDIITMNNNKVIDYNDGIWKKVRFSLDGIATRKKRKSIIIREDGTLVCVAKANILLYNKAFIPNNINDYDYLTTPATPATRSTKTSKGYRPKYFAEDWCHYCKMGGELLLCGSCPRSYHLDCLGLGDIPQGRFSCPQHRCAQCGRAANEAGGLLFRCVVCPCSFCEDHICSTNEGRLDLYDYDGLDYCEYNQPRSCSWVACSPWCAKYYKSYQEWRANGSQGEMSLPNESDDTHHCPLTTSAHRVKLWCFCRTPYDPDKFYISCDECRQWYHGDCVGIDEETADEDLEFTCAYCVQKRRARSNRIKEFEAVEVAESSDDDDEELDFEAEESDVESIDEDELLQEDSVWVNNAKYKRELEREMLEESLNNNTNNNHNSNNNMSSQQRTQPSTIRNQEKKTYHHYCQSCRAKLRIPWAVTLVRCGNCKDVNDASESFSKAQCGEPILPPPPPKETTSNEDNNNKDNDDDADDNSEKDDEKQITKNKNADKNKKNKNADKNKKNKKGRTNKNKKQIEDNEANNEEENKIDDDWIEPEKENGLWTVQCVACHAGLKIPVTLTYLRCGGCKVNQHVTDRGRTIRDTSVDQPETKISEEQKKQNEALWKEKRAEDERLKEQIRIDEEKAELDRQLQLARKGQKQLDKERRVQEKEERRRLREERRKEKERLALLPKRRPGRPRKYKINDDDDDDDGGGGVANNNNNQKNKKKKKKEKHVENKVERRGHPKKNNLKSKVPNKSINGRSKSLGRRRSRRRNFIEDELENDPPTKKLKRSHSARSGTKKTKLKEDTNKTNEKQITKDKNDDKNKKNKKIQTNKKEIEVEQHKTNNRRRSSRLPTRSNNNKTLHSDKLAVTKNGSSRVKGDSNRKEKSFGNLRMILRLKIDKHRRRTIYSNPELLLRVTKK